MKVGDLVKHPRCPTLGIGIVTSSIEDSLGLKVLWLCNASPTAEVSYVLEIVSESR